MLKIMVGSDRLYTLRQAEKTHQAAAHTGQDGIVQTKDIDMTILPELALVAGPSVIVGNLDLASESVKVRLLKATESLPEGRLLVATCVDLDALGAPLLGRATQVETIPPPQTAARWATLGPFATCAEESVGAMQKAYLAVADQLQLISSRVSDPKALEEAHGGSNLPSSPRHTLLPAAEVLEAAVKTLAEDKALKQAGGRRALLTHVLDTIEQAAQQSLRGALRRRYAPPKIIPAPAAPASGANRKGSFVGAVLGKEEAGNEQQKDLTQTDAEAYARHESLADTLQQARESLVYSPQAKVVLTLAVKQYLRAAAGA